MIYKIKDQKFDAEPKMALDIKITHSGNAIIVGTDNTGHEWDLLIFCLNGTFCRCISIETNTGFQVDAKGRIVETKND